MAYNEVIHTFSRKVGTTSFPCADVFYVIIAALTPWLAGPHVPTTWPMALPFRFNWLMCCYKASTAIVQAWYTSPVNFWQTMRTMRIANHNNTIVEAKENHKQGANEIFSERHTLREELRHGVDMVLTSEVRAYTGEQIITTFAVGIEAMTIP